MTDFTQMHVFFVVTTAAVILVTAFVCAALVALIRFLMTLDSIATEVEEEAEEIRADMDEFREGVKERFRMVFQFFGKTKKRAARAGKRKTKS